MMTIGSLFSGIGGLELGLEWAGLGPVLWQVEIDPFARAVLAHHWPEVQRHADVREVGAATLAPVELICGGFPCQDVSAAGKRAGVDGPRSGLWREFARVVAELRPRWVVFENVASNARGWVDPIRAALERLGYASLPVPIAARDVGAPRRRDRVFIVGAHADDESYRLPLQPWQGDTGPAAVARGAGAERGVADAVQPRREGASAQAHARGLGPSASCWWASEPDVGPVVHGVSGGMAGRSRRARIRALGNAVVPQCAEVVGWVIRELLGPGARTVDAAPRGQGRMEVDRG